MYLSTGQNHITQTQRTRNIKVSTQFVQTHPNPAGSVRTALAPGEGTEQTLAVMRNWPLMKGRFFTDIWVFSFSVEIE